MKLITLISTVAFSLILGSASSLRGQESPSERMDTALRARCLQAAQLLNSRTVVDKTEAYRDLSGCDVTAPPILAQLWAQLPNDQDEIAVILQTSRGVKDERVVSAAERLAINASARKEGRVAAMIYLASLVDPSTRLNLEELSSLNQPAYLRGGPSRGRVSHDRNVAPASPELQSRAIDVISRIAEADSDQGIRYAAIDILSVVK